MKVLGVSLPSRAWLGLGLALVLLVVLARMTTQSAVLTGCLDSQVYCPGVGCISGTDKCIPGSVGGPSRVFSKETFTNPCAAKTSCPGGTRTDGPCLMAFA
jgi:hypothetical protein